MEIIRQAQVDMSRLNKEAWVLNQAVDSVGGQAGLWEGEGSASVTACVCTRGRLGGGRGQSRCNEQLLDETVTGPTTADSWLVVWMWLLFTVRHRSPPSRLRSTLTSSR